MANDQDKAEDTVTVFVKAASSRKRNGGIWRSGFFFTMQFHEVEVTESQLDIMEKDPNLVVSHDVEDDVADNTVKAASAFAHTRTMSQSLMASGTDEDEEDETEEEDEDEEKSNAAVDRLLSKSSKKVEDNEVKPNGPRKKVKTSSGKTSKSDEISASKPQSQTDAEINEDDTPALKLADDPLDPRDEDDPTL